MKRVNNNNKNDVLRLSLSNPKRFTISKYLENQLFKYNITGFKTLTGRRQPVGYLQAWPRI